MTMALHPLVLTGPTVGQLTEQEVVAPTTVVEVEAELSGGRNSLVPLETLAELVMFVPSPALPSTVNENVKMAVSFASRVAMVQVMAPFASGAEHVKGGPES